MRTERMLEARQLGFDYGTQPLFVDTGFTLTPGNIYGLLGLNGAGKSTLLRLMTGLLFPKAGRLQALGYDPARRDPRFLADIFMLPEELNVPGITGEQYVSIRAPFYPGFDHARMEHCLGVLEIPGGKRLTKLSHGQQKKFLLAFGLACNVSLLLLDEPTNGLDIPSKGRFRRLVAEALSDEQILVVSTHQVRDVESLIDLILIVHEGRVLLNCSVAEVTGNLRFSVSASRPEKRNGLLHSEPTVGGFASVWEDANAGDGRLDLELLFNAVIANPDICADLFNSERPK